MVFMINYHEKKVTAWCAYITDILRTLKNDMLDHKQSRFSPGLLNLTLWVNKNNAKHSFLINVSPEVVAIHQICEGIKSIVKILCNTPVFFHRHIEF